MAAPKILAVQISDDDDYSEWAVNDVCHVFALNRCHIRALDDEILGFIFMKIILSIN